MFHQPVQSWQDKFYFLTDNTLQACHSVMTFWILNYWAVVFGSSLCQKKKGIGKHREGQVVLEFVPGLSLASYQIQIEIQAKFKQISLKLWKFHKIAWDHPQTKISVWDPKSRSLSICPVGVLGYQSFHRGIVLFRLRFRHVSTGAAVRWLVPQDSWSCQFQVTLDLESKRIVMSETRAAKAEGTHK